MELKVGQKLFEAIKDVTGLTALESDMQAILWAVEEDNNLKNIDSLHGAMNWVAVADKLPEELYKDWHLKKYWVQTEKYGCDVAFFKDGCFMKNYSSKFLNVVRWMELPEPSSL